MFEVKGENLYPCISITIRSLTLYHSTEIHSTLQDYIHFEAFSGSSEYRVIFSTDLHKAQTTKHITITMDSPQE